MSSHRAFVSAAGLRRDGRRPRETRRLMYQFGALGDCDGSAYLEQGCNKVLVAVHGPRACDKRSAAQFDRATVTCSYQLTSFARTEHRKVHLRDRRSEQVAMSIRRTFEAVIQTHLYPRSEIAISVHVLQADGGEVAAAINATTLALFEAGIPCTDFVVSCTAGHLDKTALLDLNYEEENSGGPVVRVSLLPSTAHLLTTEMTSKMSIEAFEEMLTLAQSGCVQIYELLKAAVKERVMHQHTAQYRAKLR